MSGWRYGGSDLYFHSDAILEFVKDRLTLFELDGDEKQAVCKIQLKGNSAAQLYIANIDESEILKSKVAEKWPAQLLRKRVMRRALLAEFPKIQEEMQRALR